MKSFYFLILILILATVLRLTTVPALLSFTPDEEYQAYITQTLIKDFHIIWIGLSAGGFGFYLGPFWNYLIYPFLLAAKGDPLVLGYVASFLGILTTVLLYFLGKELFSKKVGLLASFFYASLPLVIYYDQKPYPSGISFLSVLLALSLYLSKYSNKWWVVFAIAYGMVFHIHPSLAPILFVGLYWAFWHRQLITKKIILLSILAFIITISPLIAFDYFHKASNITTPFRMMALAQKGEVKINTISHIKTTFPSFGRVFYLTPHESNADEILYPCQLTKLSTRTQPPWFFSGLALSIFILFLTRKSTWKEDNKRLLALLSLTLLIPYILLPFINSVEYYLVGFFPLLLLTVAATITSFPKPFKSLASVLFLLICLLGIFTVLTAKKDFGLEVKKQLVNKVMHVIGDNPYDLKEEGDCHKYEGWRYLFSVYGRKPERSSEDKTFAWLYPDEVSTKATKYSVIIKETRAAAEINKNYNVTFQEGGFTAYIYEH
ncbi:glycosyltransferase family 39 protein [Candidatus Daviesbacteria bacterium]|nr:glycosyltransferase family 39 protein [Candidatus Daviesbacteria bacterium]